MWRCPVGDAVTIDAGAGWRLTLPLPAASLYRRWEEIEWRLPLAPEKTRERLERELSSVRADYAMAIRDGGAA